MKLEPEERLAQWVIDNRYPKSDLDKISDFEMFHFINKCLEVRAENFRHLLYERDHQIQVLDKEIERLERELRTATGIIKTHEPKLANGL